MKQETSADGLNYTQHAIGSLGMDGGGGTFLFSVDFLLPFAEEKLCRN